jgi:hypothetical protein
VFRLQPSVAWQCAVLDAYGFVAGAVFGVLAAGLLAGVVPPAFIG